MKIVLIEYHLMFNCYHLYHFDTFYESEQDQNFDHYEL